jgi:hypothetical protein
LEEGQSRGEKMGNKIVLFLIFAVLLFSPNLALADCVSLAGFTSWFVEDTHNIVFYRGSTPLGRLHIPDCTINRSSSIHLIKSFVCDSDKIVIDSEECTIMAVTLSSSF